MVQHISKLIPPMEVIKGTQAPAKQELAPLATGEEKKLAIALHDTRICQLREEEPLLQALRYVMLLVGMRANNLPDDAEREVLVNYIVKHFGGHTPAEIKLAFEMAVSGELDMPDRFTVQAYENFSVLYFSTIMNAYRNWSKQAVAHAVKEVPVQKLAPLWELDLEIAFNRLKTIDKLPAKVTK